MHKLNENILYNTVDHMNCENKVTGRLIQGRLLRTIYLLECSSVAYIYDMGVAGVWVAKPGDHSS